VAAAPAYPTTLRLDGRRVLVVGGGTVASRRVRALVEAGAVVDIVAPDADQDVQALVGSARLRWQRRPFEARDVWEPEPAWLVHAATDVPAVNAAVAAAAEAAHVWCVRADDRDASSAWSPAVARGAEGTAAEGITVAVTGGGDPRRAAAVRDAVVAGLESGLLPVRRRREDGGRASSGRPAVGRVALVGGGPGHPGLITVRGRQLLAAADVVVTDRLGPRELLDGLGADVVVVDVGKTPGHHPIKQSRINEILVEHALAGRDVVRLKGGDPFVLGRGGEEALHCAAQGVPVEVVPGVTSAVAVPAAAGIPVTHRGITASFVVASAHDGASAALDALRDAPVSSTVVLLMGVTALADTARRLVASGRPPHTPVAIVESGWTPAQRTTVTTLADAAEVAERAGVRSPAVVVVGDVVALREQVGDLVPADLLTATAPSLVLLAHGSPDPRHAKGIEAVAALVRQRWPGQVHTAYLDHHGPSAAEVAARLDGGVLVPLLLTEAYHVKTDVPAAAAAMAAVGQGEYPVAGALGPHRLLFDAAAELVARADGPAQGRTGVVLYAGGSSDREALVAIAEAAVGLDPVASGAWAVAALAGGDDITDVVARMRAAGCDRVVVVTYLVADGVLRDRMVQRAEAAGALVAPGTLGDTGALADLVVLRAREALTPAGATPPGR
jgi:uroporphyrin-III C-methyltransferase/precorrin-2 dehydrogenase/sirohydrochlorin ferrochelatase